MKDVAVADFRNVVLLGHTGAGKTTLLDAVLHRLGVTDRQGSSAAGTSFADWTDEEKEKKISTWAKPFQAAYTAKNGRKYGLCFIDTPGYADFIGQMYAATMAADAALIVVDATSGLQVGSHRVWKRCDELGLPRGIVITGLDKENADFEKTLKQIQEVWGRKCVPIELPTHDRREIIDIIESEIPAELKDEAEKAKNTLEEDVAEEDDALLEKYLGGEHLTHDELVAGLRVAIQRCHVIPVFEVEPLQGIGIKDFLEEVCHLMPSPADRDVKDADGQALDESPEAPFSAHVWRTVNDPYVGQMSFMRIYSGTIRSDSEIFNSTKGQKERIGPLHVVNGRKDELADEAHAGEIIALPKLKNTALNDSVCAVGHTTKFTPIVFPPPVMSLAVTPKTPGDEDKIGVGLQRVAEDDPTLRTERNTITHELILTGMGDIHLDLAVQRMKKRSNVDVVLNTPKVAYQETVTSKSEGHYKHKKQSGGRGQYGEVYLKIEPLHQGDAEWFVDGIVGTCIPRNFLPAIEKGIQEGMARGALAGYPVVHTKVTVYDGSAHDVDSSEVAFKIASARAFSEGVLKAKPVLLEPIMSLRVVFPDKFMGDITGDLNHRRGRILGVESDAGMQVIVADVPQAETFRYSSELRSITHGEGTFELTFSRYDVVPANVAQKVIAASDRKQHVEE